MKTWLLVLFCAFSAHASTVSYEVLNGAKLACFTVSAENGTTGKFLLTQPSAGSYRITGPWKDNLGCEDLYVRNQTSSAWHSGCVLTSGKNLLQHLTLDFKCHLKVKGDQLTNMSPNVFSHVEFPGGSMVKVRSDYGGEDVYTLLSVEHVQ